MFKKGLLVFMILVLSGSITVALAGRGGNKAKRVRQGVQSGELTRVEAKKLKREGKQIKRMKNRAKADGVVTEGEKQRIKAKTKAHSRHIYKEKHDAQKSGKKVVVNKNVVVVKPKHRKRVVVNKNVVVAPAPAMVGVKKAKKKKTQMQRIRQGMKSGELTESEAKDLLRGQKELQKLRNDAMSDGVMTKQEKKLINKKSKAENKKIYAEKHDAEKR
ncbi:hypothetical protein ACFL58_00840 [Elusimicrobiota bacterium]